MPDLNQQSVVPLPLRMEGQAELRVLSEADVTDAYVRGMNDPDVRRFVSVGRGTLGKEDVLDFIRENRERTDCLLFGLFVAGKHCGNVRLHDYDGRVVWLGIALFDGSIRGRGFGSCAIRTASDFALDALSCRSVRAGIDRENAMSVAAFQKAGFAIVEEKPDGFILARGGDMVQDRAADGAR